MTNYLLLRFRDLTTNVDTIEAHREIFRKKGAVLWGWWKKPPEPRPDPALTMLAKELKKGDSIFFINSANAKLYTAPLLEIYYEPDKDEIPVPNRELCPDYYKERSLAAWFKIGQIDEEPLGKSFLSNYVFSYENRTSPTKTITALHLSSLGQNVLDIDFLDSNVSLWFISPIEEIGVFGKSSIIKPLSRGIWPTRGHLALHLSDLHFGVQHSFRNELSSASGPRIAEESLLEALLMDFDMAGIKPEEIALVFVTGDLTWQGEAHEFANAASFLQMLSNKLGLHLSQVIVVPGNHDIEWVHGKGDIDPNAALNYTNFCKTLYKTDPEESFLRIHIFKISGRRICILGLNSCRIESKENAGLGFVGRDQIHKALRFLKDLGDDPNELRIALVHHHLMPVNYIEEIDWETKRVSIMLDAEAIVRNLISAKVQLIVHGHQHQPYFAELRRVIQGFVGPYTGNEIVLDGKVAIVGGGSIGVKRGHLNVIGRNAYNIINFGQKNFVEVTTRVRSPVGPGFCEYQKVRFEV